MKCNLAVDRYMPFRVTLQTQKDFQLLFHITTNKTKAGNLPVLAGYFRGYASEKIPPGCLREKYIFLQDDSFKS